MEATWTCSMHPQIRRSEPGACPICGMDLIEISETEGAQGGDALAVTMSPEAIQLAQVATARVGGLRPSRETALSGKVSADERRIYTQTAHFPGRIERLSINFTGERVSRGRPIAYLYSPELLTAQQELLEAYSIRERHPELYRSAREKLRNWKLSNRQIDELIEAGRARDQFPIHADYSGFVIEKYVNPGDYLSEGGTLYTIADLSQVWVQFDLYEGDLPWVRTGDSLEFTVESAPGRTFSGTIDYIDPVIDPKTRVGRARAVVDNPDHVLKPEMLASGRVRSRLKGVEDALVVPKSAVLWTGKRSVVYVKVREEGGLYFRMRPVLLGPSLGDSYVVKEGLSAGEEIAIHGAFSIDAAAQLTGKPSMMSPAHVNNSAAEDLARHGDSEDSAGEIPDSGRADSRAKWHRQLQELYQSYLPLKDALVSGDPEAAWRAARAWQGALDRIDKYGRKAEGHPAWMQDLESLRSSGESLIEADELEEMRVHFSPLSDQLYESLKKSGLRTGAYRQFCPMAFGDRGAYWLSDSREIRNPYYGDRMLRCGTVSEEL